MALNRGFPSLSFSPVGTVGPAQKTNTKNQTKNTQNGLYVCGSLRTFVEKKRKLIPEIAATLSTPGMVCRCAINCSTVKSPASTTCHVEWDGMHAHEQRKMRTEHQSVHINARD
jgi:hypothetical protein